MTELSASTGALVKVISGSELPVQRSRCGRRPTAPMSGSRTRSGNSVTELSASTGALVKVISGSGYGFNDPTRSSSDGTHVWVANAGGNSVTELSASTGALVQVISGSSLRLQRPRRVASDGTHVWVANARRQLGDRAVGLDRRAGQGHLRLALRVQRPERLVRRHPRLGRQRRQGNSVTELSASTGALVKVISGSTYRFDDPDAVSSDGTHVWVANYGGNSVTELSASTGALVKVISGSAYRFNDPHAIASDGTHVWVANYERRLGDRAVGLDRRAGQGDLRLDLRVQLPDARSRPTAPTSGSPTWRLGDGAVGSTGALVKVISGSTYGSTPRRRSRPTARTSGSPTPISPLPASPPRKRPPSTRVLLRKPKATYSGPGALHRPDDARPDSGSRSIRNGVLAPAADDTHAASRLVMSLFNDRTSAPRAAALSMESGGPGKSNPRAPSDPGVTVSRPRALLISPQAYERTTRQWANRPGASVRNTLGTRSVQKPECAHVPRLSATFAPRPV